MFCYQRRPQYHETDQMGIIHHANYIKWMEEARIAFLAEIGFPYEAMEADGLVSVQSHGYDVHEVEGLDPAPVRPGALQREGESEMDYVNYLTADAQRMHSLLPGGAPCFAYPYGWCDMRSEVILREAGVWCTFTTQEKTNVLVRGLPQSLRQLGRYNVPGDMTGEALVALLEKH